MPSAVIRGSGEPLMKSRDVMNDVRWNAPLERFYKPVRAAFAAEFPGL